MVYLVSKYGSLKALLVTLKVILKVWIGNLVNSDCHCTEMSVVGFAQHSFPNFKQHWQS